MQTGSMTRWMHGQTQRGDSSLSGALDPLLRRTSDYKPSANVFALIQVEAHLLSHNTQWMD